MGILCSDRSPQRLDVVKLDWEVLGVLLRLNERNELTTNAVLDQPKIDALVGTAWAKKSVDAMSLKH